MSDESSIQELWNFRRPEESERRFRERLAVTADRGRRLELMTQIGRSLGLQRRFAEADAVLDEVEGELDGSAPVAEIRLQLERGRVLNSSGDPVAARSLFEQAWERATTLPHHDLAVDAAHMVAIVSPPDEARLWNERALEYAEGSGDPEALRWLGSLYNNMGWDAHEAGDYEQALYLHEKCWAWHRERDTGWGERVAKWSVAKQLRYLGRLEEALGMQEELLAEYVGAEPGGEGFVHEELAELLLALGDTGAARPHFARARDMLARYDWVEPDRLQRLAELGSA